jgi:KGK domain
MTQKLQHLQDKDVVWIESKNDPFVIEHETFLANEFLKELGRQCENIQDSSDEETRSSWFGEGIDCEVLKPNHAWQKGKVRIRLEFIPEVEEEISSSEEEDEIEPEASPLDEIRKLAKEND